MCLAIVKPKGVLIPEEHLQNGWENNDHGCGFVYIDEHQQFVIHKFMTYAAFIEEYKVAEEMYGNDSDFLIHFRIASKGKKTIENCHPFQVDDDRVIIHNGTLYNITIDKKDDRSDTKVFAEDWLSQLPADWEDNPIIPLMVEDFISSGSKICMLHRTKGVYIFNEDRGVWKDGVWYSNSSYEKHNAVVVYNNFTNTFYSFKWNRMVTPLEAKFMSADEIYNHRNWDRIVEGKDTGKKVGNEWVACDLCGDYDVIDNMIDMEGDHKGKKWCWDCYKEAGTCVVCAKVFAPADIDEYYNSDTGELVTLCDDCEKHVHCIKVEKIDKEMCKEQHISDEEKVAKVA